MAFEFKKLSDVNAIETVSETTNVLVEENGEIVKISTSNILPKEVVEVGILDYTNIMPGVVQYNNPSPTITEIVESSQKASDKIYEYQRICLMATGDMVRRVHTKIDQIIRGQERTLAGVKIYFGDDLCPIIFDKESNTVYLDPNWVAPVEPIPAPATAEIGQVVAVKAVDENGKPIEWEAVDAGGSDGVTFKDFILCANGGDPREYEYSANMTCEEFRAHVENRTLGNIVVRRYYQGSSGNWNCFDYDCEHFWLEQDGLYLQLKSKVDNEELNLKMSLGNTIEQYTPGGD